MKILNRTKAEKLKSVDQTNNPVRILKPKENDYALSKIKLHDSL